MHCRVSHLDSPLWRSSVRPYPARPLVLVVDDDQPCLDLHRLLLESEGHRVGTVRTMTEACTVLGTVRPELVVADAMLPDAPPFALVRWLAHTPQTRDIPVLVCTAAPKELEQLTAAELSPHTVMVPKSFDIDAFLDQVRTLLQGNPVRLPA
jgi:CheY-like chemotaxis protein